MKTFRRLLVANRGEIAIRIFRATHELGIRTVAIYSHEDRYNLHRFKAEEAYQVGVAGEPIKSYLNIPAIIALAKEKEVDAIHPGYGFLSENAEFAAACREAGITFVGPTPEVLESLGNKVTARHIAKKANVPTLSGSEEPIQSDSEAVELAEKLGYPVILKASYGGGGRGMRVVREPEQLITNLHAAQREAGQAFGKPDMFIEKFIERARHIEVQLLGDNHGNLLHLHERDCSIQRRHQKVAEIAPAPTLSPETRKAICDAAVAIGKQVDYNNAGTVEFLYDEDSNQFFFIEVNPRVQVEHTVTEVITGIDIVSRQIMIAMGHRLDDDEVGLKSQESIPIMGYALQCRVTTEDPSNDFRPDYGRILHYRSAGGMGIRQDAGNAFSGALVTPYFDSLLVKVTAYGHRFATVARRMERALQEFRIRGVKTNIPFLLNLVTHKDFLSGNFSTRFIDNTPDLFNFRPRQDRATKLLTYLAEVTVNGHPQIRQRPTNIRRAPAPLPAYDHDAPIPDGTKQILDKEGADGLVKWIKEQKKLLLTDTTMRDAHQSLLATRMRSYDMNAIAPVYARKHSELFSLEMWGGATFDTAMRFLYECPWQRLADLRTKIPNILFQMLLRASNAVGYTTYPDNVVVEFIKESASAGMDIFRVFDSLNWVENMTVAMEAVRNTGKVCEAAICYTGDILNPKRTKYTLQYYVELAKELEKRGAHILAIKDMSGLCKPLAAGKLVKALKQEIGIPIHFHTHDTAGVQAAAIFEAAREGLDIADGAWGPFSGLTSQPNLNSVVEMFGFSDRETGLEPKSLNRTSDYWEKVREFYKPLETTMVASSAEVYQYEIPGGQFTNLQQQANALGLGDRFHEVCEVYAQVNQLFGDIVKVTPSSKVVGDLALFMVTNNYSAADVVDPNKEMAFPESVVGMLEGKLGFPPGGWPVDLQKKALRGKKPIEGRPGASLAPADLDAAGANVSKILGHPASKQEILSWILYPQVFTDFARTQQRYSDPSVLPTPSFYDGLVYNEEVIIDIEPGKTLIAKLTAISEPNHEGMRTVFFELNGQPREVTIFDKSFGGELQTRVQADPDNPKHVGSPMPGTLVSVAVAEGNVVKKGQKLASIEAMKMETTLYAETDGKIAEILVKPGSQIKAGDLLITYA